MGEVHVGHLAARRLDPAEGAGNGPPCGAPADDKQVGIGITVDLGVGHRD